MTINSTNKLALSPEARAALTLPLWADTDSNGDCIRDAHGRRVMRNIGNVTTSADVDAELAAFIAALVNEALAPAAPANGLGRLCEYDDCDQLALPGDDWCAEHKAEHDQLMLETVEPETTTELAQAVAAQLESAQLAAQYTAANDARREG